MEMLLCNHMCGRYALEPEELYKRFRVDNRIEGLRARHNIAPGQSLPVVHKDHDKRIAEDMRWGLVPHWAKDEKIGYRMINARAETVREKPSFRSSFKSKRCLVPTSGFYEWTKFQTPKIPYFFHLKKDRLFAFAGLFDEWKRPDGTFLKTYTIITTAPNELVAKIHDRMPVILNEHDEEDWMALETERGALLRMLEPYPAEKLEAYPVSRMVNKPENDYPDLIRKSGGLYLG